MRKKIKKPKENLLGCISEDDLYSKLFEKSSLVFPEYGLTAKRNICKHLAELIASDLYSGDGLANFSYKQNKQLSKHLENLAIKGFAVFIKGQYKGTLKLNTDKIKKDWLNIDHQKTNDELEKEAFNRAEIAANKILDMRRKENCFDIARWFEFLLANLKRSEE